jgi:hypothetical protein
LRWHRDIVHRRWAARSRRGKTGRPATRIGLALQPAHPTSQFPPPGLIGSRAYSRWSESARLGTTKDKRKIGKIRRALDLR